MLKNSRNEKICGPRVQSIAIGMPDKSSMGDSKPAIAEDAKYSYRYAEDVLEERFPQGEPAIAESAEYSYLYAEDVLEERFPQGEPAIRGSEYQEDYEELVGIKL
jgi:uncharacterized membrane protein